MPTTRSPRKGTLQYWPRKKAKSMLARVRSWADIKEAKLLGFAGYKVGMTHVIIKDNKPTSITKGEDVRLPVTVIECPPLKVAAVRFYKKKGYGLNPATQINFEKFDRELKRKITLPKKVKKNIDEIKQEEYDDLTLVVYTQPKLTTIGKKKPELFEIAVVGSVKEKFGYAKSVLGKEINVKEVFSEGQLFDSHSITKGKGVQGPVKRFGVALRAHKSEKKRRGPGNVGPWTGNRSWTVAHAGQQGFQTRTEYNKWILKIGEKSDEINPKGGFIRYGLVKNPYLLVKGSVPGAVKRLIKINHAIRPARKFVKQAPELVYISTSSRQ